MKPFGAAAVLVLLPLATATPLAAGSFEVKLELPLRPKLSLSGREKLVLAPFLVGTKAQDERVQTKVDLDREFRRYLQKQLQRKTKLTVSLAPEGTRLPSADLTKLKQATSDWRDLAAKSGADVVVTGAIDFDVQDRTGYKKEEYVSPIDGRTYYRQVMVEETGYGFDIVLLAIDGRTGEVLLEEPLKDFRSKEGRGRDELAGLFENLFALEEKILGIFVSRKAEARRVVFD